MSFRYLLVGLVSLAMLASCSDDPAPLKSDAGSGGPTGFRKAVVPVFYESCALTACHGSRESNLGIYLPYEPADIYRELTKSSTQATNIPFVKPGDPEGSYLMLKMDGRQATLGARCTTPNCGAAMPPGEVIPQEKRDIIRRWIAAGAKDD